MFSSAQRIAAGRYSDSQGERDITVSLTRVYNGTEPFEVLIKRRDDLTKGPVVIQRVVVDIIEPNVCQGQNIGRHGEPGLLETFTDMKIKNCLLKFDRNHLKVYFKEFKFPSATSAEEIEKRELMFSSVYSFSPNEDGGLDLVLCVSDAEGKEIKLENYHRVDNIQRKYSVTFDKMSRY